MIAKLLRQSRELGSLLLLLLTLVACDTPTSNATPSSGSINVSAGYKPPFLPVKFSIDSEGHITISGDGSIVTPIGEFSIEAGYTVNPDPNYLTVIIRDRQHEHDTVYYLNRSDVDLVTVTNGTTMTRINNKQVLIDAANVQSVEFQSADTTTLQGTEQVSAGDQAKDVTPTQVQTIAGIKTGGLAKVVGVPANDPLQVRTGPGTQYQTLAWIMRGQQVRVDGGPQAVGGVCRSVWWRVHWSTVGWANDGTTDQSGPWMLPQQPQVGSNVTIHVLYDPGETNPYNRTLSLLNDASVNATVLGWMEVGRSYAVIGGPRVTSDPKDHQGGHWWQLQVAEDGWSCGDYLQAQPS